MKYKLVYTRRAQRDISRISPDIKENVRQALENYSEAPLTYARKMVDPSLGTYRFRVGDYRIIFDIYDNDIVILRIGHRRDVYRRK